MAQNCGIDDSGNFNAFHYIKKNESITGGRSKVIDVLINNFYQKSACK